jgi:hypothetical protein
MVPDEPFTRSDNEMAVRILIRPNLAVLLENAFDALTASLMSHDPRVKACRLLLSDRLALRKSAEYLVVITLDTVVSSEIAQLFAREVGRWKKESLTMAIERRPGKAKAHNA